MKLVRYGRPGAERPGLIDAQGILRDLSAHAPDIDGPSLDSGLIERLLPLDPRTLPVVEGTPRLGPCVAGPSKIVCIGLNYVDHAREAGASFRASLCFSLKPLHRSPARTIRS